MIFVSLTFLGCAAAVPLDAMPQDPVPQGPEPVAIVEPFAKLIGSWRGEGTAVAAPGQPAFKWAATADVRWILGGHFAQEDLRATQGDRTPLHTRTVFGWDGTNDRFVAASVANDGRSRAAEVVWATPEVLVATSREASAGSLTLQRGVWEFGDGRYTFRLERTTAAGAWQTLVTGEFVRVDAAPKRLEDVAPARGDLGAEMVRVALAVGSYSVDGEQVDAAGRTLGLASGVDVVRAMYGGQALAARMTLQAGDMAVNAHRYIAWNASDQRYDTFTFDDRGGVSVLPLRWDGEFALIGERLESEGGEGVLASKLIEFGGGGIQTVRLRAVRSSGEVSDQITLRYRRNEDDR